MMSQITDVVAYGSRLPGEEYIMKIGFWLILGAFVVGLIWTFVGKFTKGDDDD
jgi:hypothetical protein